jgi:hypothetical protein
MEYDVILQDSFAYAKDALLGKWVRWMTFVILALPFALVQFVFDPEKLMNKTTGAFSWELVPWGQVALLFIVGIIFGLLLAGYTVRIFRGAKPAPDFDNWAGLFVDGLKLYIVWLFWFLPFILIFIAGISMMFLTFPATGSPDTSSGMGLVIILLLLLAGCITFVIAGLYSYLGAIRFARTGSIREGIAFSKITEAIRNMGWISYLVALLVLFVVGFVLGIITMILSLVPYLGWVLVLVINPFITIMFARYATLVYEKGETPRVAAGP